MTGLTRAWLSSFFGNAAMSVWMSFDRWTMSETKSRILAAGTQLIAPTGRMESEHVPLYSADGATFALRDDTGRSGDGAMKAVRVVM